MCLVGGWRGKGKGRRIGLLSSLSLLSLGFDMGEVGQFRFSFHPVLLPTPLRTSGGGGGTEWGKSPWRGSSCEKLLYKKRCSDEDGWCDDLKNEMKNFRS